jgi:hypothetical protein
MIEREDKKSSVGESRVFGMTKNKIIEVADALSQQKEQNHPTQTGSYQDLIKNVRMGREALSKQDGYCKKAVESV